MWCALQRNTLQQTTYDCLARALEHACLAPLVPCPQACTCVPRGARHAGPCRGPHRRNVHRPLDRHIRLAGRALACGA